MSVPAPRFVVGTVSGYRSPNRWSGSAGLSATVSDRLHNFREVATFRSEDGIPHSNRTLHAEGALREARALARRLNRENRADEKAAA